MVLEADAHVRPHGGRQVRGLAGVAVAAGLNVEVLAAAHRRIRGAGAAGGGRAPVLQAPGHVAAAGGPEAAAERVGARAVHGAVRGGELLQRLGGLCEGERAWPEGRVADPVAGPVLKEGVVCVRRRGGLVWFGSRLAPKVVTHGQCARTSPARLGTPPGCLVSQPPRLLMIPVPCQGADEREIPPCLYV